MEQSDKLIAPWADNNVGNALAVIMETRKALLVDAGATGYGAPKPASIVGLLLHKLDEVLVAIQGEPPFHTESALDSAAEERIAVRAAQLVVEQLTALQFKAAPAAGS